MKILRVIGAVVVTAVLLVIASKASRGKPEFVAHSDGGYTFEMTTVPKFAEHSKAHIDVKITGAMTWQEQPVLRFAKSEHDDLTNPAGYRSVPLILADSTTGSYFAELSTGARGGRIQYYMQILDGDQEVKATFLQPNGRPFVLKYFGDVPPTVLISHIVFMFATVFCVAMAAIYALPVIGGAASPKPMLQYLFASVIMTVIGGYPLGFAMNWYAFGGIWEGVPFGTDATDNKTQLLLVYLVFATVIGLGSLTDGKRGRDVFSRSTLGIYGFGALIVMLLIYLIPHSIQFSKMVTYTVCYSFIGFWALVYLIGWFASRPARRDAAHRQPAQKVSR